MVQKFSFCIFFKIEVLNIKIPLYIYLHLLKYFCNYKSHLSATNSFKGKGFLRTFLCIPVCIFILFCAYFPDNKKDKMKNKRFWKFICFVSTEILCISLTTIPPVKFKAKISITAAFCLLKI